MLRSTRSAAPDRGRGDELEIVFKALADRHRVKILNRLISAGGEAVCVCDFEEMLDLKQSTVSYHLKQLLDAGIVEREKRGSYAYFSLAPGALAHVAACSASPRSGRRASQSGLRVQMIAEPALSRARCVSLISMSVRPASSR